MEVLVLAVGGAEPSGGWVVAFSDTDGRILVRGSRAMRMAPVPGAARQRVQATRER